MLYHLLAPLGDEFILFNLFRYITFRSGGAVVTALFICLFFGPAMIRWLKRIQGKDGQPFRTDMTDAHALAKRGTPTMGGVMILTAFTSPRCSGPILVL